MPTISAQQELPKAAAIAPTKQEPVQAAAEAAEPKAEPEKLSPQFAALARKEKALRLEAQRIKLEREAVKAEKEQFKSSAYVPKERLTKETLAVLAEAGLSHDQIAQMLLASPTQAPVQDPTIAKLMARIEELEGKQTKVETDFKDNQTKAYDQAVNQIRNDAKILIDSDPAYETIKARNQVESVVKHIQRTFEEDGLLLSVEDAAKEVEEALLEEAIKIAGLSKVKAKLQPEALKQEIPRQQPLVKTLTHDMTSAPSKQTLSAKDRYNRAILRAKGFDPDTGKPIAG